MPARVLHIIQTLDYGGMERLLANTVRLADPERVESHILALSYMGRFAEGLDEWATLHRGPEMTAFSILRPAALARTIRGIAPDVVHMHSGVWYKASLAARLAGVRRMLYTEHGRATAEPWHGKFFDRFAAARTDTVVAVSESVADILRNEVVPRGCPVRVILNGVDTDVYRPREPSASLRSELGLNPRTPVLGSIGRLQPIKGYDVMVEAFVRLRQLEIPGPAPVLVLAGDGSEMERLRQRVVETGLGDCVHLLGWRDDVHDLLSCFSVFTMSSRSEGTSVSLLEAMSSGLCPVVTRVGGNPEVLGPELEHGLVPSESPAALARVWADVLSDPVRLETDGARARARVEERYSLRRMVDEYVSVYTGEGA